MDFSIEWPVVIAKITGVCLMTFIMYKVNQAANKRINIKSGDRVLLRMHKVYLYTGIIGLSIATFPIFILLFVQERDAIIPILFITLLFGTLGGICYLYYRNHTVEILDQGFRVSNWLKDETTFEWREILEIKHKPSLSSLMIMAYNKKAKINYQMVGFSEFVFNMEKNTRWTRQQLKLPV